MINLMRKNQRVLMLVISVLTIISFVWLYNRTDVEKLGKTTYGSLYGQPVNAIDFERLARQMQVAYSLGLMDLVQNLAGRSSRDGDEEYVWNTLVLRHVADQLQVAPSDASVGKRIEALPVFQTDGKFDQIKYSTFVTDTLTPRGYTTSQMEDLVRDDLRLSRLKELLGSSIAVAPAEVRSAFAEAYQKRHLSRVRLNRDDFAKTATVTPEEIKAYYEKNKATFQTAEKRSVKYVVFQLTEKDQALQGKERVAALQPLSNKAEDFSQKMLSAGAKFEEVAASLQAEVKTTAPFAESSAPTEVSTVPTFAATAYSLTAENPDSDVLQTENAFYLLHLDKIEPSQPETLEQATPAITSLLQEEKTRAAMTARGTELQKQFTAALKSGQTFAQAAEAAGLKAETITPFSAAEPGDDAMQYRDIQMGSMDLQPGAVSDLIETPEGGSIVWLEKIDPMEDSLWEKRKTEVLDRYATGKRDLYFAEWLRVQRELADVRHAGQG